ncbi:MAG: hypothetical protein C0417_08815 [Chlorobiaceae bacterium]|nr:hypothetical protein [Chlorobiaceae bacterium]
MLSNVRQPLHILFLASVMLLVASDPVVSANRTFTGPGNFSDATKWSGSSIPNAGDNLWIRGTCTFDNAANSLAYGALDVGHTVAGTLNWPVGGTNTLNVTDVSSTNAGSAIDMTNGGTLQIRTSWTTTNQTFTPGTGTITFAGTQTMPAAISTYNNLTINIAAGTVTFGVGTTVNGNLLISAGTLSVGASNFVLNAKGNFTNNAGFTQGSGTVTLNGTTAQAVGGTTSTAFNNLTISNTSATVSANTNFSVGGTLTVNGSAVLNPAAAVVISGSGTLTGSGTVKVTRTAATADFASQYTITAKTLTNLTVDYDATAAQTVNELNYFNLTVSGNRGSATVTLASGTVGISGTFTLNATNVVYATSGNTVDFNGSGAQTITAFNYNNLTVSATRVTNNITWSSSSTIGIADVLGLTATFTSGSHITTGSTIDYNGASAQSITATSAKFSYYHLILSNTGAKSISSPVTATGNMTVNAGASVTVVPGVTLQVNGDIGNAGTITNNGIINAGN